MRVFGAEMAVLCIKNAQDGISMVQTYEGALTETDAILQRMKTLADQAANGTYQDDVDRDAIQLEFDQLNDELNQIADTDFNGVIVLNGGVMSDGTVAKDGKFDYALGRTETVVANEATDISGDQAHTIVDQTFYDKEKADAVYNTLGIDVKDVADKNGNAKVNVTFMYDGERWMAQTVTDKDGKIIEGANAANLEARAIDRKGADGKGGFEVVAGKNPYTGEDIVATNAIFDEMKGLKKGDTVTISFDNTSATTYAPKNAGIDEETYEVTPDADTDILTKTETAGKISFKLDESLTDEAMTTEIKNALDEIDKTLEFTVTYAKGKATVAVTGDTLTEYDDATGQIKLKGKDTVLGTLKVQDITQYTPAQNAKAVASGAKAANVDTVDAAALGGKLTGANATKADGADTKVTISYKLDDDGDGNNDFTFTIKNLDGANGVVKVTATNGTVAEQNKALAAYGITLGTALADTETFDVTYTPSKTESDTGEVDTANGTVEFGLNIDAYNVVDLSTITVHAVATPDVATMAHKVANQKENGVSQSNAFKQASAPLTYTDHIILQSGARSKDAVDFTFKYATGGMGDLKANMNCSAREDGLNTANLSLRTAKDANYAIDRIDNAINKVSMVRATFGAVQNRLEHKIDNMNVTKENMTSAESRIRDTNMAEEMTNFTKNQILSQASQAMLAQANQLPQGVLQLLG